MNTYNATRLGDSRAAWLVRPDHSMVGMQDRMSTRGGEQMRGDRQLQPAPSVMYGTWSVDIDAAPMTAVPVTGDVKFRAVGNHDD
jgi:hypothetical protein